jgi:hypothetical protein
MPQIRGLRGAASGIEPRQPHYEFSPRRSVGVRGSSQPSVFGDLRLWRPPPNGGEREAMVTGMVPVADHVRNSAQLQA